MKRSRRASRSRARQVLDRCVLTRVRDDGSCWIYGVLAGLGLCEHAKKMPFRYDCRQNATTADRERDAAVRDRLHRYHGLNCLKTPIYDDADERLVSFGSYGGERELSALAQLLGVDIAIWGEPRDADKEDDLGLMDSEACYFYCATGEEVTCHSPYRDETLPGACLVTDVLKRMDAPERPLVHLVWSSVIELHFEAYVEKRPSFSYTAPSWLLYPGGK